MSQARMERRLEAILFADVVGYSRLTGRDEVGTWWRLQNVLRNVARPNFKAHAGRIVRIKGDGILVEFPSAVEAVVSAVALQQAMAERNTILADAQRIELRIGINLGDIVTSSDDIHGDGVNIACRLEPLAEPGGICISATVHEHVHAKLSYSFDNRGERALKNIALPVVVYALGPQSIASLPRDHSRGWTCTGRLGPGTWLPLRSDLCASLRCGRILVRQVKQQRCKPVLRIHPQHPSPNPKL